MPGKNETVSLDEISFDEAGRAIISKPETVARLRASVTGDAAIKNIGCCSAPAEMMNRPEELARMTADAIKTIGVDKLGASAQNAIKNIGCCSVT